MVSFENYTHEQSIQDYAKQYNCSQEESREVFVNLKYWLKLVSESDEILGLSQVVDNMRHLFLEDETAYGNFCETYCGKYINHTYYADTYDMKQLYQQGRNKMLRLNIVKKSLRPDVKDNDTCLVAECWGE